jgi:hypothetical protein
VGMMEYLLEEQGGRPVGFKRPELDLSLFI